MASRRVQHLINNMTDRQLREAEEAYKAYKPDADCMEFEDYIEDPEFEEEYEYEIDLACRGDIAGAASAMGPEHYVGTRLFSDIIRAGGGRGGSDPRLPSGASNTHGPASATNGGRSNRSGAPPPPSRGGRWGRISSIFGRSPHRHSNQQNFHRQARSDGYGSHGGSTDLHSGHINPAKIASLKREEGNSIML